MSKGVEKDVAADNTELKKQLHHHQPGLELFVNCLIRLNVCVFYGIEMSPMTMASGSWSATTKNSTNNSQLLGRSTHSVRLLVIYWPLLNEIPFTFSLSPKPGGNCCLMSSEAFCLRDVKGCFKLFKLLCYGLYNEHVCPLQWFSMYLSPSLSPSWSFSSSLWWFPS